MKTIPTLKFLFLIVFLITQTNLQGQKTKTPYVHYKEFQKADSNKLFFRIENFNFIKNNEYSSKLVKGATWIGYLASPKLVYYPSSKIRIEVGGRFQKYSGRTSFTEKEPVLSVNFMPTNNWNIILGSLNQNNNHCLSEPLYNPERFFTNKAENGLQAQYKNERFSLDTWINWQQFILENDPFQEKFTFGISGKWRFNKLSSPNEWSIPFEMISTHKGGEIDSSDDPVQTLNNSTFGLQFTRKIPNSRITSWTIKAMRYSYSDSSTESQLPFDKGYAYYPQAEITTKNSNLAIGYWNAYKYIAPKGVEFFQSIPYKEPDLILTKRELVTLKYYYEKKISNGIFFGGKIDLYYDLKDNGKNSSTAIYLRLNGDFFLKKLKWN